MPESDLIGFAERVLALLEQTSYTATYKYAVLLALMDLCLQGKHRHSLSPDSVTTRQLAEKVIELYWPQTNQFAGKTLHQNRGGRQAKIVGRICRFRHGLQDPTVPLRHAKGDSRFEGLVRDVEWTLIEMPLPRLQKVGGNREHLLYELGWRDEDVRGKASFNRSYEHAPAGFYNSIQFLPGVGDHLAALNSLLRPLIHRAWSGMVAQLNGLQESRLEAFLFGVDRVALAAVRTPLLDLQSGRCFYCDGRLTGGGQVDHFIPWARYADNGLENLVVADENCNRHKRDFLAAQSHLSRWRMRNAEQLVALSQIAEHLRWESHPRETLGVARALYYRLPAGARLWVKKQEFCLIDPQALRDTLA